MGDGPGHCFGRRGGLCWRWADARAEDEDEARSTGMEMVISGDLFGGTAAIAEITSAAAEEMCPPLIRQCGWPGCGRAKDKTLGGAGKAGSSRQQQAAAGSSRSSRQQQAGSGQ